MLRGRCLLLPFLSPSSHLHIIYPICMANQREIVLVEAQCQSCEPKLLGIQGRLRQRKHKNSKIKKNLNAQVQEFPNGSVSRI